MTRALITKDSIIGAAAIVGSGITSLLGGWDQAMQALLIFMIIDFITGVLIAVVWKKSPKSACGAVESKAAGKGLIRKGMYLFAILVACQLDVLLGLNDITRNAAIYGFLAVEGMSIIENMGIMGVPLPPAVTKAFTLLKQKSTVEESTSDNGETGIS